MPNIPSSLGDKSVDQHGMCALFDIDFESLINKMNAIAKNMQQQASRVQEEHEERLARIVADQWMHVARKRLTMAWCFQMVYCWHKICSENKWTRQKTYLASEYHTRKNFLKSFYAFREGHKMKMKNQSTTIAFYKQLLQKKTMKGLNTMEISFWRHHEKKCLEKAFSAVKRYYGMKKVTKRIYNAAQLSYKNSLMKQTFNGLSKHQEQVKLKWSHQEAASYHWKQLMKSRILKCWRTIAKRILDLKKKGDQSRIQFFKALLKRCMKNWLLVTQEIVAIRKNRIAQASQKYNKSYKKRMLQAWTQWYKEKQSKKLKLKEATTMHNNHTSAIVTNAWHKYAIEKGKRQVQASLAHSFKRRQSISDAISIWKAYQAKKMKAGSTALKALTHLKKSLTKKSMATWRPWHERHISKKHEREKALDIYKSRLQRWACERILAVGLMLQALRLESNKKRLSTLSTLSYMKVAPYARKWWFIAQRRNNFRKSLVHQKDEIFYKNSPTEDEQFSNNKESFTHEVVLRIGIDKDGLKIQHRRPPSPQLEMTNTQERPQPRGRELLAVPSLTPSLAPTMIPMSATIRRPIPRRPTFL